jgi:hypothetical protein
MQFRNSLPHFKAETACVNYRLSFDGQGKQTFVLRFRLQIQIQTQIFTF